MSTRPAPLRPSDRPPSYRLVTRVYGNSLRPIVILQAFLQFGVLSSEFLFSSHYASSAHYATLRTFFSAIPAFQDISEDKDHGQPKFATFDIVLGVIYIVSCAIEAFGVLAATTQRVVLVRAYAFLSLVAAVAIVAAAFLRVVIHFVYKNGLISECEQVVQGQGITFRFGIWGPRVSEQLDAADAAVFCNNAWNRDSLDEILFLIFQIIFAIFFTMIAFAYYHQVLDPTSAANVSRTPANPLRGDLAGQYPDHYNRPYDAENAYVAPPWQQNVGAQPQYAPPPGPPPTQSDMGYGVGVGIGREDKDKSDVKGDNESDVTKFDDPFADFDAPSGKSKSPPPHQF
uniref:MDR efflux pump ABC3 n=1 Tax=Ganoderma boninense TaxID=34458 RepID=A0A5K1K838_9APHY|nr:MDR efflux pump ABC3 [Ganoderma boninense]